MRTTGNTAHREPWNKGKIAGQKAPFKLKDIWALRVRLQMEGRADYGTHSMRTASGRYRSSVWPSCNVRHQSLANIRDAAQAAFFFFDWGNAADGTGRLVTPGRRSRDLPSRAS